MVSIQVLTLSTFALFAASAADVATEIRTVPLAPEQRADIFMARKMYREAIDKYREAPDSAVISNKLGIAFHQLQDLGAARRSYQRAVKMQPSYSEAVNNLGTIFYAQKDYRRAIKLYKSALRINPQSASIYSNLGTAYFARKDYRRASEAYQKALSIDPEVFDHHSHYGVLLQDHNVADRARFHYYLARTYAKAGMTDRALEYIRKALEEGFEERKKFLEEPEFTTLRVNAEFQQLMAYAPRKL